MNPTIAFFSTFALVLCAALVPEIAYSAPGDPLTIGDAERMATESNTVIAVSTGALAFMLGWVAGSSS